MLKKLKNWIDSKKADSRFKEAGPARSLLPAAPPPSSGEASGGAATAAAAAAKQQQGRARSEAEARSAEAALSRLTQAKAPSRPRTAAAIATPSAAGGASGVAPASASLSRSASSHADQDDVVAARPQTSLALRHISSVKYSCPLCEKVVLGRDVKDHLVSCLFDKMPEDPVFASAGLMFSVCESKEALEACVNLLMKYLKNIADNVEEPKYRKIRQGNSFFQSQVKPVLGAVELLHAVGFVETKEGEELFYVLNGAPETFVQRLLSAIEVLQEPTPIVPDLFRDPVVYQLNTTQALPRFEVPDDFFELSSTDVKQMQAARAAATEEMLQLRTQAMREAASARKRRRYLFALIRVRFPDKFVLQGTFHASEGVDALYAFVAEHLRDPSMAFELHTHPERVVLDPSTSLGEAKLLPAVVVNFSCGAAAVGAKQPLLRDEDVKAATCL